MLFNIKRIHIDERPKRASKRHGQHKKIIEGNLVSAIFNKNVIKQRKNKNEKNFDALFVLLLFLTTMVYSALVKSN